MVLKPGLFGKQIRHTLKVLKSDVGEGCRRSVELIFRNEEVLRRVKGGRNFLRTIKQKKVNWIRHVLSRNCILIHGFEDSKQIIRDSKTRKKT